MLHIPQLALFALAVQDVVSEAQLDSGTAAEVAAGLSTGLGGTEGPDMTRYLLVCSGILLAVGALAVAFRRVVGRSLTAKAAKRSLQIMDVLPMGGRKRLAVVRCYDRTFLLGMGEKEMSLVAELDPVIEPASEPLPLASDRKAFADLLERVKPSLPRPQPSAGETIEQAAPSRGPVKPVRLPDEAEFARRAASKRAKTESKVAPRKAPAQSGGSGWVG